MRRSTALTTLAGLSLVLAACSADSADEPGTAQTANGGGGDTSAEATFDVTTVEADPEVEALVPEDLKASGTLINGVSANYPPAEYFAEDGTTITGFDIQLADAMARKMGLTLENKHAEFASILPAIGSSYDVGISSFSLTAERMQAVNFTVYLQAGSLWAVSAGNPQDFDPTNPCGATIGVQTGTIQHDAALERQKECQAKGEDLTVEPFTSQQDVTTNVIGGRLDAMFADSPVVADAITKTNEQIESIGELEEASYVGALSAKDDDGALAEAMRAAYQSLMDDGTYAEILDAWGVTDGHLDEALVNPDPAL